MIIMHVTDQLFNIGFVDLIFKKSVNNMRIKLYNKLPSQVKILKNIHFIRWKLESFLL